MKIELEIPFCDFKGLIKELKEYETNGYQGSKLIMVQNQMAEEGGYTLEFQPKKGYCHETGQFENLSKVVIKIDTFPHGSVKI